MTAVIRAALARRAASTMMSNSIRFWFVGGQVGWTRKTSRPRMFSLIFTNVSPSGNVLTVASPSGTPMPVQMRCARSRCAEPQKIFISVCERNMGREKRDGDSRTLHLKHKRKVACASARASSGPQFRSRRVVPGAAFQRGKGLVPHETRSPDFPSCHAARFHFYSAPQ